MVDEGAAVFGAVVGMDGQAGALVHQQDVLILVDDVQLGIGDSQEGVVLSGLVEKFVIDVQLQHIACFQTGVPLGTAAVALDALDADVLLGQGSREQGNGLGQEPVQTLSGVVGADGKFFHSLSFISSSKWRLFCSMNSSAGL